MLLQLVLAMHVTDGHGPIVDFPGQLLHWQLLGQCSHWPAVHPALCARRQHTRTERPERSTPSTAVRDRVGDKRRQLYLGVHRHMACMARAAERRG